MKRTSSSALIAAMAATAAGPAMSGDGWSLLEGIEIEEIIGETSYEVRKTFPAHLENGMPDMELTGYVMPLTPGDAVRELILVSDMGLCPFCASAEHGASVQVNLAEPLTGLEEGMRVTLRGDMRPMRDPETWQAAIVENAVITSL